MGLYFCALVVRAQGRKIYFLDDFLTYGTRMVSNVMIKRAFQIVADPTDPVKDTLLL